MTNYWTEEEKILNKQPKKCAKSWISEAKLEQFLKDKEAHEQKIKDIKNGLIKSLRKSMTEDSYNFYREEIEKILI